MNAQSISEIPILPNFTIQAPSTIVPNILFLTEALAELQADHPIWFEQHRTRIYSAANDVTNGAVHPTSDPQKFMVASHSRPDVTHLVDRQARKCRCEWGYNGKLCRHRIAVHLALRGFDLQETYERDQQEREQARKRSELFENPKGAWDNVNGQIIHICPDGFSGANVFGVGSDMWCGRCTENMPTQGVEEGSVRQAS